MSFNKILKSLIEEKFIQDPSLNTESAFCEIVADYLQDSSLISDFINSTYYREEQNGQNLKIDGFCLNENETVLSLFIARFNNSDENGKLNLNDVEFLFKQLYRVLINVIFVNHNDIPKAHVLHTLNTEFKSRIKNNLLKIDFYLFTNNLAVNKKDVDKLKIISPKDLESEIDYNFRIYDIQELERLYKSNQKLDIDVIDYSEEPIKILKPEIGNSSYGTAIAVLPGKFLYNIYSDFGGRLLESNVRSFLSSKVKINQGIKNTLIHSPEMFLAYNNGLCVTVSEIILNDDKSVKTFKNFQIVNGGQTTSSIFFATQDAKKLKLNIALERVYVMAKITEIRRNIDSVKIQTMIAENSNLQNAVKQSDLSSNEEYLINLHTCSKKFRNPNTNNYYYFERTRGQYQLEKNLSRNEKHFLNLFPYNQKIEKTDLSNLYYCAFGSKIEPFISVQSAEKRYNLIKNYFEDENKKISEEYYVNFIGSFILFKSLQSIYGSGQNAVGRIRKNVIAYSISLIQTYLKKSNKSINFQTIWSNNGLNIPEPIVKTFLSYINDLLLKNLDDGRLDEACKKEESWNKILKIIDWEKLSDLINLFPVSDIKKFKTSNSSIISLESKNELIIKEINQKIYSIEKYKAIETRIENEIETYKYDGMSLYNRSHLSLMKAHFRPNKDSTEFSPKTYDVYLNECRNNSGQIINKKLSELKIYLENLYRVFNAILQDELLEL